MDRLKILVVLFIAAVLGLVYVFLMPPWQHYDEPLHFEYAWWIAEKNALPKPTDVDLAMRRNVAISMLKYHFYDNVCCAPDVNDTQHPISIGGSPQLTNPPLYYILVSIPMRLFPSQSVTTQLYAARLVSWLLYLLSLVAAWGITVEITPPNHWLRFLLPLTLACLPGYLDIMTALNNDVGAITLAFFCLWGCVRLAKRGFSWLSLLTAVLPAILIYWTKETAYFMFLVVLVALWLCAWRPGKRWIGRLILAGVFVVGLILVISWDDAAYWYRSTAQSSPTRTIPVQEVQGRAAFQIDTTARSTPAWLPALAQPIPRQPHISSQDRTYTLGAWVWADKPMQVSSPILAMGPVNFQKQVSASSQPVFVSFTAVLPAQEWRFMRVILQPSRMGDPNGGMVYYDGIVVVEGNWPLDQAPVFDGPQGDHGTWGGLPFTNMLRNGSAEMSGPRLVSRLDQIGSHFLPDNFRPSLFITSLYDRAGAAIYFNYSSARIFRTFWGWFGWGSVQLLGHKPYRILLVITLISLALTIAYMANGLWRRKYSIPWDILLIFGLVLLGGWGMTLIRGAGYIVLDKLFLPVARYGFPALIPVLLLLSAGWAETVNGWMSKRITIRFMFAVLQFAFLLGLQIWSVITLVLHYYT